MYFSDWERTTEEQDMLNFYCLLNGTYEINEDNGKVIYYLDDAIRTIARFRGMSPDHVAHEMYCDVKELTKPVDELIVHVEEQEL